MDTVLDAHGLMVYLEREAGYEVVKSILERALEGHVSLLMTTVNVGEVLYIVLRERGQKKAREIEGIIKNLPITLVSVDLDIAREAARFKAHNKMSYADCFAAALAKQHHAALVTGDPEFKAVEEEIQICWV